MDFGARLDQELSELRQRLAGAASEAADAAVQRANVAFQQTFDKLRNDQTQIAGENERLTAENAALTYEKDGLVEERNSLSKEKTGLLEERDTLSKDKATLLGERDGLTKEKTGLLAERDALSKDKTALTSERDGLAKEKTALLAERDALSKDKTSLLGELDALAKDKDALVDERNTLLQLKKMLTEERNTLLEEKQTLIAEKQSGRKEKQAPAEDARVHRGRVLDHLVDVVDRIDHAGSVSEVLAAVARGLRDDLARVAIFEVRDQQFEPIGEHGFKPEGAVARVSSPVEGDTFLAHAARARSVRVVGKDSPALAMQPFGGDPTVIVTLPVAVRGGLLALIYADDAGTPCRDGAAEAALKLAHVLQRHASLRIERLTIELKSIGELTAYAKMLLDEVEYVYEADRTAKKPDQERQTRLRDNLRCARQIFQQRVTTEGPAAEKVLDDMVTAAARSKAGAPFGKDLAAAAAQLADAPHAAA